MPKRVLLAVNDRARRGRDAKAQVVEALRSHGHEVEDIPLSGDPGALSRAIEERAAHADVVLVGGGDGTLLSALAGMIASKLPLAILPLGTFNEFARTLGVPTDPAAVAALLDDGVRMPLDVGCVNGAYYLNEASIGLSTRVASLQTSEVKKSLGMFAIPVTTLRALRWARPLHVEVTAADGSTRRLRTLQLTVANSYRFGGVVENTEASLEDGRLWLYAVNAEGLLHVLRLLTAIVLRRFQKNRDVVALRGDRFTVRSLHERNVRVFADSEDVAQLPAEFSILQGGLTVLVPPARVEAIH